MVLDWLAKGKGAAPASVSALLARKQFAKAVELAQAQLRARPRDGRLRLQLADTLVAAGRGREAVPLLRGIADDLAKDGFAAKSIAVLKRIQKIDPGLKDIDQRLAGVIEQRNRQQWGGTPTAAPAPAMPEIGMEEIGMDEIGLVPPPAAEPVDPAPAGGDLALDAVEADTAALLEPEPRTPALFPDFSRAELVAVMSGLRLCAFEAGDLVVAEGEPGDSLFLVSSGTVKAWIRDREGRYVFVREMGEGDFFGEISVLSGSPRTATVVAATDCELLELDRPTLDGITATHPRVRDVLQAFYEQRTRASADATAERR
ncbi:MAG TPA: cyclic nucleotide-binding domain-containing protein [Vicinamibacteria bacterium]|nr:cyclic nucleotide-binding domain-containing protein [Vicinamibacteria bacterium]